MKPVRVYFKKLDKTAVSPYKKHDDDFCYDLTSTKVERIGLFTYKYYSGLAFEVAKESLTKHNVSIDVRPRSSVFKTGMVLSNSVGTVDRGYRGEVTAVFYHVLPWKKPYDVGERFAQIHLSVQPKIEFVETDSLSESERGSGGYGSTGK